jgi:hypothetical protein
MAEIAEGARLHQKADERFPWLELSLKVGEYLTSTSYPHHLCYHRQRSCSSNCRDGEETETRAK